MPLFLFLRHLDDDWERRDAQRDDHPGRVWTQPGPSQGEGTSPPSPASLDARPVSWVSLQAGDTVGVVRKEDGSLHFFVNGVAQGPAAWNVPSSVYAVVDLYGQAAQATIMDDMGETRWSYRNPRRS